METAGFELADFAYNGREALEKLSAGDFDLIITDIRMPVMNGLDLAAPYPGKRDIRQSLFSRVHIRILPMPKEGYAGSGGISGEAVQ